MLCPEQGIVCLVVGMLIAAVAVHSVGINHQLELDVVLLQGVYKLKGILEMHVIVSCAVSQLKGWHSVVQSSQGLQGTRFDPGKYACLGVSLRVGLGSVHVTLGVVRIV